MTHSLAILTSHGCTQTTFFIFAMSAAMCDAGVEPYDSYDALKGWKEGQVPHVVPVRPVSVRSLPHVPAGPDRLRCLLEMWIHNLPEEEKDSLKIFLHL